jgi:hypothetical protein
MSFIKIKKALFFFIFLFYSFFGSYAQNCQNLFISEYVEGWSNNKAIEIYNPTPNVIDLANYKIARYSNGAVTNSSIQLVGLINPFDVHVAVLNQIDPNGTGATAPVWITLQAKADQFYCPNYNTNPTFYFNGDDALALLHNNVIIDIFGKIGENPLNNGWSSVFPYSTGIGEIVTKDHSLIRKLNIQNGVIINPAFFDPLLQWDSIPPIIIQLDANGDTIFAPNGNYLVDGNWNSLGHHVCQCDPCSIVTQVPTSTILTSCTPYVTSNGLSINTSQLIIDTLQTQYGCDSILNLDFTYSPIYTFLNLTECGLQYTLPSGTIVFSSGTYIDTISNINGCDSIITFSLILLSPISNITNITMCGGPYIWNNQSYSTSGTYTQTFQAANGCDSIVTLNLTINNNNFNPSLTSNQQLFTSPPFAVQFSNTTANIGNYNFTWYWGDGTSTTSNNPTVFHEYLTNGLFTVTLEATNTTTGCTDETTYTDYIFTTGGVSCTHTATINQTGPINSCAGQPVILTCNSDPAFTYQWRKNGVYIPGNNNDTLIVTQSGSYSVIISVNGCPVASTSVSVNFQSITQPTITSSGTIQPCIGGSVTLTASSGYSSYLWSNGATTQTITVNTSGNYTVQGTGSNGCTSTSNPYTVNASFLPTQNICVVGVDSLTNNIRVVWEEPLTTAIDSFYIYKESNSSNVYTQVGSRAYDSLSVWIDPVSNPAVQSYRYKITALDTCGVETPLSDFHKTIHLTINQGVGGAWNLIWSHYEGINFGSYNIYRGTSSSNMTLLTTIQSNLNSYTDLAPPSGIVYYQIEIVNPNNCTPTKSTNYGSSKSNIATNDINNIGEMSNEFISVYPNPTTADFTIEITKELIGEEYLITDFSGRLLRSGTFQSNKEKVELEMFSNGVYLIQIKNRNIQQRIIKQ